MTPRTEPFKLTAFDLGIASTPWVITPAVKGALMSGRPVPHPEVSTSERVVEGQDSAPRVRSWSELLPAAQRRLAQRRSELLAETSDAAPWPLRRFDSAHPTGLPPAEPPTSRTIAELARSFASAERSALQVKHERRSRLKRLGGTFASLLAHALLILLLAAVSVRMPRPAASLAFESASSDPSEPAVELTQPLQVQEPEAAETATRLPSLAEVAAQLPNASAPLDAMSPAEIAKPAGGLSSAARLATPTGSRIAQASFFGAAAGGNNFCYVIDASGSMRGGPWEAARMELLKSLSSLGPKQRFYILIYTRELKPIPLPGERSAATRHLYATAENLEHARRWLFSIQVGGSGAAPKEALKFAIEKEPDAIYLLTDGVTRVKDVAEFVRQENRVVDLIHGEQVRVPIHTIAFYTLEGQSLLRQIAAENRGQFIYVPDPNK